MKPLNRYIISSRIRAIALYILLRRIQTVDKAPSCEGAFLVS